MKSSRAHAIVGIVSLLSVFFNFNSVLAGSLTAETTPGGVIILGADFSTDFNCELEGQIPITTIGEASGCFVVTAEGWTAHGEHALACANPGHQHNYIASASGGRYINGICSWGSASASASVIETTAKDVDIIAPVRVPKTIVDIDVSYDFKYNGSDCSGLPTNRQVSLNGGGVHSGLPVSGSETFSYNFSNSSGVVRLIASACCNGSCRGTNKYVYIDPDDLGGASGSGGGSGGSSGPGGPGPVGPPPTCSGSGSTLVGKPVNLANGNVFISQTDFSLSGVMPINFTRYYNSKGTEAGGFYTKWRHTFDIKATESGNSYKIINADNSINYYMDNDGDGLYLPELPKGLRSTVTKNTDDTLKREYYDGSREEFNKYGYLTGIVDRNGSRIILARDSGNKLVKITDPAGREINFTYDSSKRIIQISLPDGKIFGYTYVSGRLQKATYPDGTYRTYEYTSTNLTGIKDENGNYIEKHTYDSQGRVITSSADGTNEKLTISYLSDSQSTVTDSLGRVTTYTIDKSGGRSHSTSISGPGCSSCGQGNTSYTYDNDLNITSKTDANGYVATMTYDLDGNMLTKTEAYGTPQQRTTTYTYNDFGEVLVETDNNGTVTSYTYDDNGNMLSKTEAYGTADARTTTYTYNASGQILTVTDPNGNVTTNIYDQLGNLASVTNELNQTSSYTYDIMGNRLSMTDANGNITIYEYDLRYRLKKETRPDTGVTNYEYDFTGNRTALVDANGNRTTFNYDTINRMTKTTDASGSSTNYVYDTEGNMTSLSIKDSSGNLKTSDTYTYDNQNRLTRTTHLDGTYAEQGYDAVGNVLSKRDKNGYVTTNTYDALNRLHSVTDPMAGTTSYTYDSRNNLTSITDANGHVTTYTYDNLNRLISTSSPDTGTTTYTYDDNGNMLSKTDANGITTAYAYDALNRQTTVQFPDSSQNITYAYDNAQYQNNIGRLSTITDPSGTASYDYDSMGRIKKETKQIDGVQYITENTYDLYGNLLTATYPGGRVITYSYNNLNKAASVTDTYLGVPRTLVSSITYQPFGDITSMTYGNGIVTTKTYNNRYQLNGLTISNLKQLSYTRDNTGNITAIIDTLNPSTNKSYTYDNLYRLSSSTGQWGSLSYTYDGVGNRQTETTGTGSTTYTYTANTNKLASVTGEKTFSFSYDADGNTTVENTRQFIYNQNQRLKQVTDNSTVLGDYVYNARGQRVKKTVNGQTTVYNYDQNAMLIMESTGSGTITAEYAYLNGQPLAKIENNNIYYYYNDHLGTPMLMTDSAGSVVWQGEYLPFGEPVSVSGSITNNLRFPGQYYDAETGLNQNWHRDYKPEVGRYLEADPLTIIDFN
ncbi:MAG: DUF6531 domain-containing protein, partial [Nitrospirota bacterium]